MTRNEAIAAISEMTNIKKNDVAAILDAQDKLLAKTLRSNDSYALGQSGKVEPKHLPARTGRNPSTGGEIEIAAKNTAKFKPAKHLLDALA